MRITEAAQALGISPRMLRYRESLGLLPPMNGGERQAGSHRQYNQADLRAVTLSLALERRYGITPAALAFGLRVLAEPDVTSKLRDLSQLLGHPVSPTVRALDFEKQRALRWLRGD